MTPLEFARLVQSHDGANPFNEASRMAMADELRGRVEIVVHDGPRIVAMAYAPGDAPVECAVHPEHRRRGHATALLDRLVGQGETRFWAHGDLPGARGLASACNLDPSRTLLRMSRPIQPQEHPGHSEPLDDAIRAFRADDLPGLLAVNARAFASHPEQGTMDAPDFERRAASSWFNPGGIFVAEHDGTIVGFHWTKVEELTPGERRGEVYVLAVDPDRARTGLASRLLHEGLRHLAQAGARAVELYVDADNAAAVSLYEKNGFAEADRDVLYVSTTPA
ncbi:MAG: mycothiol synthase [Aeromicrobium sp.]